MKTHFEPASTDDLERQLAKLAHQNEPLWRATWSQSPMLRDHFGGNEQRFLAYMRAEPERAALRNRQTRPAKT